MKLAKICTADGSVRAAVVQDDYVRTLRLEDAGFKSLADLLHADNTQSLVESIGDPETLPLDSVKFLAPVDEQEVWAAGVTYKRSQVARMEESESAASHYDKVYSADRPELFFKGNAWRMVHPEEPVRVRYDSDWSVPEPEFTLVLNPQMQIVGYTIGNDMSARDIEGENPLYLPQAKVYKQCCSVGPCIMLADQPLDLAGTEVQLAIHRGGEQVFEGTTNLGQLNRKLQDLANWLGRENEFPHGALLLTGTGIVPDDDFSLEDGDSVSITVTGIGTLTNPVVKSES